MKSFIAALTTSAGNIAKDNLYRHKSVSYKKKHEVVTSVDRRIEKHIVKQILQKYPSHDILGEEGKYKKTGSSYMWVIDPIDGTENYVNRIPHFCTSVALLKDYEPIEAAVYDPMRDHLFYAKNGAGFYFNGSRHKVSAKKDIKGSIVALSILNQSERLFHALISKGAKIRIFGSTALCLCHVAAGWVDARIKITIGRYDVAGGALMIREAGGEVTDFTGEVWHLRRHTSLLATNRYLKKRFLKIIKDSF